MGALCRTKMKEKKKKAKHSHADKTSMKQARSRQQKQVEDYMISHASHTPTAAAAARSWRAEPPRTWRNTRPRCSCSSCAMNATRPRPV